MKKMNQNKKQNLKSIFGMLALIVSTLFVSCEEGQESFPQQGTTDLAISGEYIQLNATIINSDNGIPQGPETLKSLIGNQLELAEDGSFKGSIGEGTWVIEKDRLFLYPVNGLPINLEVQNQDGQSLDLLQVYDSYRDYANGTIAYTFIKKGSKSGLPEDLLSSLGKW